MVLLSTEVRLGWLTGNPILYEEASLIQSKFHAKCKSTILAKNNIVAAVWHVWKERNLRIFQLESKHKIMVFQGLYEDIRLLQRTCNWKVDRNIEMQRILSNWNV